MSDWSGWAVFVGAGTASCTAARAGMRLTVLAAILVAGFAGSWGCASRRIAIEGLPEAPIAFMYWEDKASQKRSDVFAKVAELPPLPPNKQDPEGQQELEIRAYLRAEESFQLRPQLAKHPGRLTLYWPRTGELERVEAAPPDARPLAWSKDHRRLLFASAHRGEKEQLYEYHLDRRDLRPLSIGPDEHPRGDYGAADELVRLRIHRPALFGPSESTVELDRGVDAAGEVIAQNVPPGTLRLTSGADRIVYEQVVPRPRRDGPTTYDSFIATREARPGSEEQILLAGREPTLTPDGEWIVFASPSTAGYRLRRMRLDGTARVAINPGTQEERMPTVSPDGEFIAFIRIESGKRRLTVRRFDGQAERELLSDGWSEFPVW
jgi:WD40-like Beta Propeller Repeat